MPVSAPNCSRIKPTRVGYCSVDSQESAAYDVDMNARDASGVGREPAGPIDKTQKLVELVPLTEIARQEFEANWRKWDHPVSDFIDWQLDTADARVLQAPLLFSSVSCCLRSTGFSPLTRLSIQQTWRQRKRLGLVTFTRTVSLLLGSETLESFVQSSEFDLDSVAPIAEVAVNNSLIELGANGTIVPLKSFKFSQVQREKDKNEQIVFPRAELN